MKCKGAAQSEAPSPLRGREFPQRRKPVRQVAPCRICGQPTKYTTSKRVMALRLHHCDNPECAEQSRQIKNERISQTHLRMYANGERERLRDGWQNVSRVSKEEAALHDWFVQIGWLAQYPV